MKKNATKQTTTTIMGTIISTRTQTGLVSQSNPEETFDAYSFKVSSPNGAIYEIQLWAEAQGHMTGQVFDWTTEDMKACPTIKKGDRIKVTVPAILEKKGDKITFLYAKVFDFDSIRVMGRDAAPAPKKQSAI